MNCIVVVVEGLFVEGEVSGLVGFESRSNGERWRDWRALPVLIYRWVSSRPPAARLGGIPKTETNPPPEKESGSLHEKRGRGWLPCPRKGTVPKRKAERDRGN